MEGIYDLSDRPFMKQLVNSRCPLWQALCDTEHEKLSEYQVPSLAGTQ